MRAVLTQHKIQQKRARMRRVFFRFGAVCLLGGGSILFLLLSPRLQFTSISLSGNTSVSSEEILRTADRFLTEHVWLFFPRRNIFLFRPGAFEAHIRKQIPRVGQADVSRSFSRELVLNISERALWGLYCKTATADCYYIAEDGVLAAQVPDLTGNAMIRIVDRRTKSALFLLGDTALSESDMTFLRDTAGFLESRYHVGVREIIVGREFQDQTELITSERWRILYDARTNKERALANLALALDQRITNRAELEYIDIRFEGKVFYKKK